MPSIIEETVEIEAPVSEVFAYLDDFTNAKDWLYGLKEIRPVGEQLQGVGATYEGVMKLGVSLSSRLRCTAWEKDKLLEIDSVQGIENTQRWSMTPLGQDRTKLDVWISYSLPGGPAGRAMAAAVKPLVGVAVKHTSERLVRNLERG